MFCRLAHFTTDRGIALRGTPFSVYSGSDDSGRVVGHPEVMHLAVWSATGLCQPITHAALI